MPQFARPDSLVSAGGWIGSSGTLLWDLVDETVASDTDYVQRTGVGTLEVGLGNVTDPQVSTGHTVRFRARVTTGGSGAEKLDCQLYQGAVLIASSGAVTLSRTAFGTFTFTLTGAQADAITNYDDLRLRFVPNQAATEVMRVSWAELEVPDATAIVPLSVALGGGGSDLAAGLVVRKQLAALFGGGAARLDAVALVRQQASAAFGGGTGQVLAALSLRVPLSVSLAGGGARLEAAVAVTSPSGQSVPLSVAFPGGGADLQASAALLIPIGVTFGGGGGLLAAVLSVPGPVALTATELPPGTLEVIPNWVELLVVRNGVWLEVVEDDA